MPKALVDVNLALHLAMYFVVMVLMMFVIITIAVIWIWFSAKREVVTTPKEPMLICDIHGAFPARCALTLDVPSLTSGHADFCPYCIRDRVSKKKVP